MSLKIIKERLENFFQSSEPSVLILKGDWGVGKTYVWNLVLQACRKKGICHSTSYSYISLFGKSAFFLSL
jgi:tRNA A37 threonylcarbamoyladenosine biosynthesis protein TsaE